MVVVLLGETTEWVQRAAEWGSPMREAAFTALGLVAVGGMWLLGTEAMGYFRVRRVGNLRQTLRREGRLDPVSMQAVERWLGDLEKVHGQPLEHALQLTRKALVGTQYVAQVREVLETHLLPVLDERIEQEIRRSALKLGVASSFLSLPLLDGVLTLWFSVRLARRVATMHGARPGFVGTAHLLREVSIAALGADLSQHAADALSTRVGSLAAAAGQGLVTATLVVRVGLWTMNVCRPIEVSRPSVGGFVVRGAAQEFTHVVKGGVQRAMSALHTVSHTVSPPKLRPRDSQVL